MSISVDQLPYEKVQPEQIIPGAYLLQRRRRPGEDELALLRVDAVFLNDEVLFRSAVVLEDVLEPYEKYEYDIARIVRTEMLLVKEASE